MNGKTHYKIGILSCAIASVIPTLQSSLVLNNDFISFPKTFSIVGLGVAALAALATDADSATSRINKMNPVLESADKFINSLEDIFKFLVRLLLGTGLGILIFLYSDWIIKELSSVVSLKPYATPITYGIGGFFLFSGLMSEKVVQRIPIIGFIYNKLSFYIKQGGNRGKKATMFLCYAGTGAATLIYNFTHLQDPYIYLIGCLLIAIGSFPHRSFLHSIEGLITFTISASYLFNKIGYGQFSGCFFIGYASHIYWADIFTASGVPLFILPRFLEFLGIKSKLLHKMAKFKLRVPPHISTGSKKGNLFEEIYVLTLFLILIAAYVKYGASFTFF